ncbi:hypothetical protein SAMN05216553_10548 [Lentzea fradiae]|uniref:Histidine kinase/HSP90-like ATPase domain-containing protein n=1 Tax=Lentzea fradiae TaxID=200378 RepID=A0A1G7R0Z9_9PSEU|nr:ATP-binding protein [Lentzea fradiae]SDG04462.1 hypothetical protein SAMN05216553_10548 [Lentzea fradiae]
MTPSERSHASTGGEPAGGWHALDLVPTAPDTGKVRRWTEAVLANLHEDDLVDVLLVVTELVSNVYDHASFPARLKLRRSTDPCLVAVVTEDASPAAPRLKQSTPDSVRSRGMVIVDRLSRRWGVARQAVGKRVWAVVPCPTTS